MHFLKAFALLRNDSSYCPQRQRNCYCKCQHEGLLENSGKNQLKENQFCALVGQPFKCRGAGMIIKIKKCVLKVLKIGCTAR